MPNFARCALLFSGAATVSLAVGIAPASAQNASTRNTPAAAARSAREAELEARLQQLEASVAALRGELEQSRRDQAAQVAAIAASRPSGDVETQVQATQARVAALEARPTPPAEGFRVGASTVKLGGFVKVVGSATRYDDGEVGVGALGKEFYLPQQIPVGGTSSRDVMGHARQTRLFVDTSTPFGAKELKTHIEFDFGLLAAPAGTQRSTNPYTPTFRRGFISYGNFLVGQEWSNFQNPAVLPETTDFVGPMEGTVFARQMIVQYKVPLGKGLDLFVAAENPQTETVTTTSAALVDNDHDRLPDVTAKLAYKGPVGEFTLAGIARELSVRTGAVTDTAFGWGVSAAGRIPFGPEKRHDLRFMATYGQGIGRYLSLGYVSDSVYDVAPGSQMGVSDNFAAFAALKIGWSATVRSTVMAGYQDARYPGGMIVPALANKAAYSMAGNLFWSPVKGFDLGVEYRHAQRETADGEKGQMDRFELAAKYGF
ncbi:DcaP family trimeric outer membrane transporter [Sphingobium aquiterrae]|uniref:DcaP family trimeric outer membrane transporter n=1 Tax=Sphingobium aquiterrae TaxID=2038656 RepID=UPI00301647D3